jgi:hypothetical protein
MDHVGIGTVSDLEPQVLLSTGTIMADMAVRRDPPRISVTSATGPAEVTAGLPGF